MDTTTLQRRRLLYCGVLWCVLLTLLHSDVTHAQTTLYLAPTGPNGDGSQANPYTDPYTAMGAVVNALTANPVVLSIAPGIKSFFFIINFCSQLKTKSPSVLNHD